MTRETTPPQNVALLAHPNIPHALEVAQEVSDYLSSQGLSAKAGSLYDQEFRQVINEQEFDLAIALGGDGTVLRAGHLCVPLDIPLLGINIGHFGFLAELGQDNWRDVLPRLLRGDFRYEERLILEACCFCKGEQHSKFEVINDVVVARGRFVRPIGVEVHLNGAYIVSYVADGLIAATPTGSTAYALAAGGPILPPESRNILLMPVAPHLSVDRAVVLSEGASVFIKVKTQHEAVVSVDGQDPVQMVSGDGVQIKAHEKSLYMVRFEDPGYFYRNLTSYMEYNPILRIKSNGEND
jgi:NAD+ kinase